MNANIFNFEIVTWQDAEREIRFVRDAVFVEELGISAELEWDGPDANYFYVIARDGAGSPVGIGRIGSDGHIGRMAVLPAFRGKGIGGDILNNLLQIANANKLGNVWLNAQIAVTAFYAKYGFGPVGNKFKEAGIGHIKMELQLRNN